MKTMLRLSLVLLVAFSINAADPRALASQAARGDAKAIQQLRSMEQAGVDAMLALRTARDARFHAALDQICKQRDCAYSGLYWFTDFEEAKRAAKRSGRPILSLRLLGNLDEELSCANSRYFRTLLYPNVEIRAYLKRNYVLHWQPVRPAPLVTVDFGDGRVLRRTITGNSIHFVLDADGRPLDAIPGLYAPPAFLSMLREGFALHRVLKRYDTEHEKQRALARYHLNVVYSTRRKSYTALSAANEYANTRQKRLDAWTANFIAPSKSGGEARMVAFVTFDAAARGFLEELATSVRNKVAGPSTIDDNALALIRAKRASAPDPKMRSDEAIEAMLEQLERTLAADTAINEEKLHRELHGWFAREEVSDVATLTTRVYEELFQAPSSDPWAGLVVADAFTGIAGEGLHARPARIAQR